MSPSSDPQISNLSYNLHQVRTNGTTKTLEKAQSRGRNLSRHELGRGDRDGERVRHIYPREMTNSPSTGKRFPSSSPASPPTHNATTSPLLSAISAATTAAQYTSEWTKSLPLPSQASPPNGGIAINGSPPTFHNSHGVRDASYGHAGVSHSPSSLPSAGMRPLSHPNNYTSFGGRMQSPAHDSTAGRDRRASMYSQLGRPPFANNPPLPHQPQEHYYNLPGLELGLGNGVAEGITAGEGGYYCGFDSLDMAGDEPAKIAENVLLVGYQGGIDIFRVEKSRMDILGRLEGLRGGVLKAKILPWTARRDPCSASRPLIALVIHGPALNETTKTVHSGSGSSSVVDDSATESPSRPTSSAENDSANKMTSYQTTVEIYSLKEKRRIAVLYQSPLIPITGLIDSPMFEAPPPAGEFVIDAKGKFVVVASGASGEVFIFAPYVGGGHPERFRCVGKVWTAVSFRERGTHSSSSSAANGSHEELVPDTYGVPIFSLSNRWLAVAPPASTTLFPVNGVALTSRQYPKPPGLSHHTVPPQPSTNCAVDAPEPSSLIDRLTREGTQVAIKGARWATEKGIQAFKNYMNKGSQPNGNMNGAQYGVDPMAQGYFPPTHGHNLAQPKQEADIISIYDLQRLLDAEDTKSKYALYPLATIPASLGCSFLSFSPTGLMLMTISTKGDFQDVWDLKRMNSRRTRKASREQTTGPHVRQVARFARMTVANIIEVVWSAPRHDRVAVITDKGTVHMFLMPASAFQWPPPRRARKSGPSTKASEENNTNNGRTGAINSAMQALNGTAKPFFNAVRARNSSTGSRFPSLSSLGMTPAAGAKSGKAVAANVGKSINNIRHAGDNKLTLPVSPSGVKPHSVRWLTGKNHGSIALVNGGILQMYKVYMRSATGRGKPATISKKKLVEFGLALIRDTKFAPAVAAEVSRQPGEPDTLPEIHGEWLPRALPARLRKQGMATNKHLMSSPAPLSFSEIEPNPAYQPFYTDRRANRFIFSEKAADTHSVTDDSQECVPALDTSTQHLDDETPWLFGEDVEVVRIASPAIQMYDSGDDEVAARIENKLSLIDGDDEIEQIVVTTKRRRLRVDGAEEEGFFEDDCDVLDFAEDRV